MAEKNDPASKTGSTGSDDLASLEQAVQAAVDKAESDRKGPDEGAEAFEDNANFSAGSAPTRRARRATQAVGDVITEMFKALRAPDWQTRRMSVLFFLALIGVIASVTLAYRRYVRIQDLKNLESAALKETSKNLGEFIQKQAEHAKKKFATFSLGKFTVDLRLPEGAKLRRGVLNVAELEIVIECDNKDTRYFVEDNLPRVRDQVTGILASLERDDLLTRDGKRRLKKKLLDHLNAWIPNGKVEELFISNQLLN